MAFFQLYKEQELPTDLPQLWAFITSAENLKKITPGDMGFDITSKSVSDKIYEGMIISYTVKPFRGFKTKWISEITHIKDYKYFVDEQRIGPFKMWHHQHWIEESRDGVIMKDIVSYQPPLGVVGSLANHLMIKKQLTHIFRFREEALIRIFENR